MAPRGGLLSAVAATAFVALAAPVVLPAVPPAAYAQVAGTITVDLVESVGAEWFEQIGDREVVVRLIEGVDPTTSAGQEQLSQLDIPALVRAGAPLPEVARMRTSAGVAEFTGLSQGVYLVEVLDSPGTRDARVSYLPAVVVVVSGSLERTVAPKPQVLGAAASAQTPCTSPRWLQAAAPNTDVEYAFTFNTPNPSTDGTISTYQITVDFSRGHTVRWPGGIVAVRAAAELGTPTLTLVGAGQTRQLQEGTDYTVATTDGGTATFTLTAAGRQTVAQARRADATTRLELRIPARANARGPWGTVSRGDVLGTLEVTATLRTDGMDAVRTPVEVASTSRVSVVSTRLCYGGSGSGEGGSGDEGDRGEGSPAPGQPSTPGQHETPGQQGPAEPLPGREGGRDADRGGQRAGLASTGAGVLGITAVGLLLIALGVVLRRRSGREGAGDP